LFLCQSEVDVRGFLYPPETDAALVDMYLSALATGKVRSGLLPLTSEEICCNIFSLVASRRGRGSLVYLIAVHHVHHAISFSPSSPRLTQMLTRLHNQVSREE